jgi:hypothetical protein
MPFHHVPQLLTIWIVFHAINMLNYFPTKGGVSAMLSPKTIMSGKVLNYKVQLVLQVSQYCQVHEQEFPCNSQLPCTRGTIALGPTGNVQGSFKFMALNTGKVITCYTWDAIPMPNTVIDQVNKLGRDQPEHFILSDCYGNLIGDVAAPNAKPEYPDLLETDEDDYATPDGIAGVDNNDVDIPGVDDGLQLQDEAPQVTFNDPDTIKPEPAIINEPQVDNDPILLAPYEPIMLLLVPQEPLPPNPTGAPTSPEPNLHCSTRICKATTTYEPSMRGNKYAYATAQLAEKGTLHPDSHGCYACECHEGSHQSRKDNGY